MYGSNFFLFWLSWLWQLPQHLLGLILIFCTRAHFTHGLVYNKIGVRIYRHRFNWGVSLGLYVILGPDYGEVTEHHELGHTLDSLIWGPLYLLVIGIASAIKNNLIGARILKKDHIWYYNQWPENRADQNGGVIWDASRRFRVLRVDAQYPVSSQVPS